MAKDAEGHKLLRELSTRAWSHSFTMFMTRVPTYYKDVEEVIGKNIIKIEISVSRVEGTGNSTSCSHSFQAHTHTTRPNEQPNFTSCNESISLGWGESGIITITDITILDGIKNGTFKGFGIKSSFDEAHYSALNNGTVKIYYTE